MSCNKPLKWYWNNFSSHLITALVYRTTSHPKKAWV